MNKWDDMMNGARMKDLIILSRQRESRF